MHSPCLYLIERVSIPVQTQTNQAIFKLQAVVTEFFRDYLHKNGFTEIHSPKLQGAATESGASVFKVQYFKGKSWPPLSRYREADRMVR